MKKDLKTGNFKATSDAFVREMPLNKKFVKFANIGRILSKNVEYYYWFIS